VNEDADLLDLLRGPAEVGRQEQAFVFLTVDEHGYPNPALLSRAELDAGADGSVLAVVASTRTKANLAREGLATLIAVEGTVAHYAKLRMLGSVDEAGVVGACFEVVEHKRDSIGIELSPISFRPTAGVAALEHWETSARVLRALASRGGGAAGG
jgi:hypothetical protein